MQHSAVCNSEVQHSAVQHSSVQHSAVQHISVLHSALCCLMNRGRNSLRLTLFTIECIVQCSAVQCSAVQCSAVQCCAVKCGAVRHSVVSSAKRSSMHWTLMQCSALINRSRGSRVLLLITWLKNTQLTSDFWPWSANNSAPNTQHQKLPVQPNLNRC